MPAVRFRVTCLGASLAAARATRSCPGYRVGLKVLDTTRFRDESQAAPDRLASMSFARIAYRDVGKIIKVAAGLPHRRDRRVVTD